MGRYVISYDKSKRIAAGTVLTVLDTSTNEVQKFSKNSLTKGYHLEYNPELCEALFQEDDMFYKRFPIEMRTDQMTEQMIRKYYRRFYEYYLVKYRDLGMSRDYARYSGSHLLYVPEEQIDQSMCDAFAYANPCCLREIPEQFMRDEYINYILKKYHLGVVPVEYRTLDVCRRFIQSHKSNIQFVPDEVLPELCREFGIIQREGLTLDKNDFWMQKRMIKRNGEIYIKMD